MAVIRPFECVRPDEKVADFLECFLDHIDRITGSLNDHAVFVDAVCLHEAVSGCHEAANRVDVMRWRSLL